jgi:hypothetical protein
LPRQRSGLVDDERIDLLQSLERLGALDEHAGLGAATDADHDRHRRRQPERAGAGDDQHGDGRHQSEREPGLRPVDAPGDKCRERDRDHRGHEPARHLVRQALDRRARPLRRRDHLHDLGQHGVAADLSARMTAADWFIVPPITLSPTLLVTGIDSPVTMDSSIALRPSRMAPSTGTRSPGRTRWLSPAVT